MLAHGLLDEGSHAGLRSACIWNESEESQAGVSPTKLGVRAGVEAECIGSGECANDDGLGAGSKDCDSNCISLKGRLFVSWCVLFE